MGLWLLDATVWFSRHLSDNMLLTYTASICMISSVFTGTEYTIALVSNGFLLLLIVAAFLDRLFKDRANTEKRHLGFIR
jgi:hypothetical protein